MAHQWRTSTYNSVQARDDSVQQDIIHRVPPSPFSNTHTRDSSPLDLCCFSLHLCRLSPILNLLFRSLSLSRLIVSPLLTLLSFLDFSSVIYLTWSSHVTCDTTPGRGRSQFAWVRQHARQRQSSKTHVLFDCVVLWHTIQHFFTPASWTITQLDMSSPIFEGKETGSYASGRPNSSGLSRGEVQNDSDVWYNILFFKFEDKTRNGHQNTNGNPEQSWQVSDQTTHLKWNLKFTRISFWISKTISGLIFSGTGTGSTSKQYVILHNWPVRSFWTKACSPVHFDRTPSPPRAPGGFPFWLIFNWRARRKRTTHPQKIPQFLENLRAVFWRVLFPRALQWKPPKKEIEGTE